MRKETKQNKIKCYYCGEEFKKYETIFILFPGVGRIGKILLFCSEVCLKEYFVDDIDYCLCWEGKVIRNISEDKLEVELLRMIILKI